jgi:hypothetical protein
MKLAKCKLAIGIAVAALLTLPAWGDTNHRTAVPGTVNYVEGQASIGNQTLDSKSVGSAEVQNGQELSTGNGKAEILLTPGVYLRLGNNSSVKMVSSGLTNTQVAVDQGEAMVEVDQLFKENNIRISQPGADTQLVKTGLYDFNAAGGQMRVFDGKAIVSADDRNTTVKGGHELALNSGAAIKSHGFDKKAVQQDDDLYRWSSLRSEYMSEANIDTAQLYYANGFWGPGWWGPGWWGPGWFWDPWFAGFTFMPGGGFLYSPFGWGFYSPLMAYRAPVVVAHGYQHFDGTRPVAIGKGFHANAVTSFNSAGRMEGERSAPAMGGFRGGFAGGFGRR